VKYTKKHFFNRQTILSNFGEKGQHKLQESSIVIVGCGGLGSVAAVYLAASGVGTIHLIDFDIINVSNLHRQVFYKTADIGKSKSHVLANHIRSISPFVKVSTSNKAITKSNIFDQIEHFEIVVDCTDSLPTKYLLNDYCVLTNRILIYGSLYKNDGYVASFNMPNKLGNSANLRDAFPKIPKDAIPNCSQVGTLNPIVGIIGLMQAPEVIKILSGVGRPLMNKLLIYNSSDNTQFVMKLKSREANHEIVKNKIKKLFKSESFEDPNCEIQEEKLLISSSELKKVLERKNVEIISVIEDHSEKLPFKVSKKIPFSQFDAQSLKVDFNKEMIIVCKKGITSYTATKMLLDKYPKLKVLSLINGIDNY